MESTATQSGLKPLVRLAYGIGDFGPSMAVNIHTVFLFFFLTEVAGVAPERVGALLLISKICNAVMTLVVGPLSDRTPNSWGRRRIWMLASAPILGISFALHWWVPPLVGWSQFVYYLAVACTFQTSLSTFMVPYFALLTDLTEDSQEHIKLNSSRFSFALAGSLTSLLVLQLLTYWFDEFTTPLQTMGIIAGLVVIVSVGCCCFQTQERDPINCQSPPSPPLNLDTLRSLLGNHPLLLLSGIFAFSWGAIQITPAILPYFIIHNLELSSQNIVTIVLCMKVTTFIALSVWQFMSQYMQKKGLLWLGMMLWLITNFGLFYMDAQHAYLIYVYGIVAGFGMAVAYLIPPSMLPEVIDWDELRTGQRQEGLFNSILLFSQKITFAFGLFAFGQILALSGFDEGNASNQQPILALLFIRVLIVGLPNIALILGLILTHFYPIDSDRHQHTLLQLQERRLSTPT
ncbi:MAG: MFS transporter [Cyanothece sp. SIO2G6]|nr:MFS transporter [Cyanothece sp. SIO2G6]